MRTHPLPVPRLQAIVEQLCKAPLHRKTVIWKAIDALASGSYAFVLQIHVERLLEEHAPPYTTVFVNILQRWAYSNDIFPGSQELFTDFLKRYKKVCIRGSHAGDRSSAHGFSFVL